MISLIQVTNRLGGLDVLYNTLKRQTFKDFEIIYHDALYDQRHEAVLEFSKRDSRVKHSKQTPKDPAAKTWLAHAENEAIKLAQGELIVFLQDFIWIQPDALEKFWNQYLIHPRGIISGVGDQYAAPEIFDSRGLVTLFEKPVTQAPTVCVWKDPRKRQDNGSFYECMFNDIEFNFCAIPRKALYDIGGLDESMDFLGFAWDNVHAAGRMMMAGYTPYIDQSNESFSINSDEWSKSPAKTEDNARAVSKYCFDSLKRMEQGEIPYKLKYL